MKINNMQSFKKLNLFSDFNWIKKLMFLGILFFATFIGHNVYAVETFIITPSEPVTTELSAGTEYIVLYVGDTLQLDGYLDLDGSGPQPNQILPRSSITWTGMGASVTVSNTGLVKAVQTGVSPSFPTVKGQYQTLPESDLNFKIYGLPPNAPSSISGSSLCVGSNNPDINLNWVKGADIVDGYNDVRYFEIYRGTNSSFIPDPSNRANTTSFSPNYDETSAIDTWANPSTTYYYKIRAVNTWGNSIFTASPAITTNSCAPTFDLDPNSASVIVGGIKEYPFNGWYDADGPGGSAPNTFVGASSVLLMSSSNNAIASIDGTGTRVFGNSVGWVTITAGYKLKTATASLTVGDVPPSAPGNQFTLGPNCTNFGTSPLTPTPTISLFWIDNSNNETGFEIYRGTSQGFIPSPINRITTTSANIISYADTAVTPLITYYYKIRAINNAGASGYVESAGGAAVTYCAVPTFTLSVTKSGTGSGTVTSDPAGINCGAVCSISYPAGTMINNLFATPDPGSIFNGFSGAGNDCPTIPMIMDQNRVCEATFLLAPGGDINVKATLDGIPWSGALFYTLGGPNGAVNHDMLVPYLFSDLVSGIYTVSYVTWGPQETIPPTTITPASSQFLPGGSAIEFVLNFKSICSDGIDNDSDGRTDYPSDRGCENASDNTETINLSCGGSPASPQLNQTVTWTASPSSGQTPYTYSWSGAVSGTTQSVQTSYSTTGTKTASVEVSSGTESKSTNCFVNVVSPPPPNNPPTAVAGISLDTTTFGSNISVTKGTPVTFNLSAWRGTQAAPSSKSDDPNGWTNITLGMFMLPARCEWDTDLVQNAASFAPDLARGILPTFAECSDPDNNASNYITLTKTFNDNPGTYTYYVLKMTDRASGVSSPLGTVSVTVKAQCENGIDDDGDGLIDFGGANPDPGCSSSTDNDETDVVGPPPAPPNPPGGGDPPTSPVCSASNNPDIILNWTDNSNNEDGFKIYRGTTETFTPTDPPLTTVSANTTTATDASPVIGTPYYYKITAYNSGGNSSYLTLGPVTADSCAPTFVIIDSSGDANSTIQINETEQYDGKYDSDGPGGSAPEITAARASISWSSLDTSIATINPTGAAKGKAVGSTKIKGTYSGIIAEANIIVATCSNDCSPSGQASCQGNAVITCGNYDADSCLEWSSPPVACGAGKTCVSGNCISSPAITFTASPGTIRQGESTVLSWNATNVDSCEASGGWNSDWSGNKPISSASIPLSDRTVSPKRTSDYTLTCVNNITGEQVLETKVITVIVVPIIRPK